MEENKITNEEVTEEEVKVEETVVIDEEPAADGPAPEKSAAGEPDAEKPEAEEPEAEEPEAEEPETEEPGSEESGTDESDADESKAESDLETFANELVSKLKKMIEEGNVTRIRVRKGDNIILNLPVNIGLIGTAIGLITAPWVVVLGVVSTVGFKCTVEVENKDGTVTLIYGKKE